MPTWEEKSCVTADAATAGIRARLPQLHSALAENVRGGVQDPGRASACADLRLAVMNAWSLQARPVSSPSTLALWLLRDCLTSLNTIVAAAGAAAQVGPQAADLAEKIVHAISQLPLETHVRDV